MDKNFHNNKIPKKGFECICILVNLLGSVFRTSKKLYRELVLEEFKYAVKEK